jgi:hypothetical protein
MGCRALPEFERVHGRGFHSRMGFRRWLYARLAPSKMKDLRSQGRNIGMLLIHPHYDFRVCRCSVFHWNVLGGVIALFQGIGSLTSMLVARRWRESQTALLGSIDPSWFPVDNCICGHRAADHIALRPALEEGAYVLETEQSFWKFYTVQPRYLAPSTELPPVPMPPTTAAVVAAAARRHRLLIHHCLPTGRDEFTPPSFIRGDRKTPCSTGPPLVSKAPRVPTSLGVRSLAATGTSSATNSHQPDATVAD